MKSSVQRFVVVFMMASAAPLAAQDPPSSVKPADKPADTPTAASPADTPRGVSMMKMTLKKNLTFEGSPIDLDTIKMSTLFGDVSLPLHTILGIRFAQGPNEQTTVVGLNGDALTGDIQLSELKFVSEWGEAKVNVSSVVSIVFRPDLGWTQTSTPNGPRWQLTRVNDGGLISNLSAINGGRRVYPPPR